MQKLKAAAAKKKVTTPVETSPVVSAATQPTSETVATSPVSVKDSKVQMKASPRKLVGTPSSVEDTKPGAADASASPKVTIAESFMERPVDPVAAVAKKAEEKPMIGKAAKPSAPTDATAQSQEVKQDIKPVVPKLPEQKIAAKPASSKPAGQGPAFKVMEFIVYPAHGVGEIIAIEQQEVAGFKLELFVISFIKDKMILKVPVTKVVNVGMRKLAESGVVKKALDTLMGRARIKRTMWSRRAQEYEAKINSGDLVAIAEVVRDLYRSDAQPEQSYSERQLYEAALDRLAREVGTVQKITETESLKLIETQLQKGPRRSKADDAEAESAENEDGDIEEAA
jgi:CarD family transcriptional regulator